MQTETVFSPFTSHFLRKRTAFTLAEVLITLGIIGVVAAMTIPNLITSYKKNIYAVRNKKFYSTMQQAIMLYNADNNMTSSDWYLPATGADNVETYWMSHFAPYFRNVVKTSKNGANFWVYFADGSYVRIARSGVLDFQYYVSNKKKRWGREIYTYLLMKDGRFITFYWPSDIDWINNNAIPKDEEKVTADIADRKNLLRLCKYVANYCSTLLQYDGWEYKSDYPHKL